MPSQGLAATMTQDFMVKGSIGVLYHWCILVLLQISCPVSNLENTRIGTLLAQGVVKNVVAFGAFIDIGVGCDGLLHVPRTREESPRFSPEIKLLIVQ